MTPINCKHPNLLPLEISFGKIGFTKSPEPYDKVVVWDEYNIMSCHRMRVTKYYCPTCSAIIEVSTNYKEKKEPNYVKQTQQKAATVQTNQLRHSMPTGSSSTAKKDKE